MTIPKPVINATIGGLFFLIVFQIMPNSAFSQVNPNIREKIDSLESKYGIKVYIDNFPIDTAFAEITPIPVIENKFRKKKANKGDEKKPNLINPALTKYTFNYVQSEDSLYRDSLLNIFFEEWEKYPVSFVKASGLTAIAFVKNLKVHGQARYALPEGNRNMLYFDVNYKKTRGELYLRHCMHHEFYHLIERHFFGNFYYKDKTWDFLNPFDFSYGNGGAAAYGNPDFSRKQYPYKGFVTGYATSGMEEDKAELFGFLMTSAEFLKLMRWVREDSILASKTAYMMGFFRAMSKEMDYNYFLKCS